MNFTTDLPKRNPLVSYIVASAVRCAKLFPAEANKTGPPVYRMHAVILKVASNPQADETTPRRQLYICCHVRRVFEAGEEEAKESPVAEKAPMRVKPQPKQSPTYVIDSSNLF